MDKFTIPPGYPGKCTPDKLKKLADTLKDSPGFRERISNAATRQNQRDAISHHLGADGYTTNPSDREQLRRHFLLYFGLTNPPANLDKHREDRTLLFMMDPPRWKDDGEAHAAATKPISFKELIETKLGPCKPDPMQELRIAKQITFADIEAFSKYMDEPGAFDMRLWRHLDTSHLDTLRFINISPSYRSLPKKETPVNTKPLTITTKTFTYVNGVDVNNYSANELYDMIAREESKIRALEAIENKPVMLQQEIERRQAGIAALVAHLDSITPVPNPVDAKTEAQITAAINA